MADQNFGWPPKDMRSFKQNLGEPTRANLAFLLVTLYGLTFCVNDLQGYKILYSYFMPVCSKVKIITQPSIYGVIVYFLLCHESLNYSTGQ